MSTLDFVDRFVSSKETLVQLLRQRGLDEATINTIANDLHNSNFIGDIADSLGILLGTGVNIAVGNTPMGALLNFLTRGVVSKAGDYASKSDAIRNLFRNAEREYNRAAKHKKETSIEQPMIKLQDNGNAFKGFKNEGHIILFGATNSGKTSWLITSLFDNVFDDFDMFVFVGAASASGDLNNLSDSVAAHFVLDKHMSAHQTFLYFHNDKMNEAIICCQHMFKDKRKLVFFDDMQASTRKAKQEVGAFIIQAKHSKCSVITTMHDPTDEFAKRIRDNSSFYVLFNVHQQWFNMLLRLSVDNPLYKKYSMIQGGQYSKILIYDKLNSKLYYGTGKRLEFDPLIPLGKENSNDQASSSQASISSAAPPAVKA
jgi:hypothetical protein